MNTGLFKTRIPLMRHALTLGVAIACSAALFSCRDELKEESATELKATHQLLTFSYAAIEYPITILTNLQWTIEIECEESPPGSGKWLGASLESGTNNATVKITATENDTGQTRKGIVRIIGEKNTVEIPVTQGADLRNFTDITYVGELLSYTKVKDGKLVLPYRQGNGETLDRLTVNVSGESRGTLECTPLTDVTLAMGDGYLEFDVTGRPGDTGNIVFTIMGLPSSVYGKAAQCLVPVKQGEQLENTSILSLRKAYADAGTPELALSAQQKIKATVISDLSYGATPADRVVVVDGGLPDCGIVVKLPGEHRIELGDQCDIYIKNAVLKTENGVLVVELEDIIDISVAAKEVDVKPILLPKSNMSGYESMLCTIDLTQVDDADITKPDFSGNTAMNRFGEPDNFNLYILPGSALAATHMQAGSGTVTGIAGTNADAEPALLPRIPEDLAGLTEDRYDRSAIFYTTGSDFGLIPYSGGNYFFDLYSNRDWQASCDVDWVDITTPSGPGNPTDPQTVRFTVDYNDKGRRTATITISAEGVPNLRVTLIQKEAAAVLSVDLSNILNLYNDPTNELFPLAGADNFSSRLDEIGLAGWTVSNCYLSRTSYADDAWPVLRVGKSSSKGYIETPKLSNLTSLPSNIEFSLYMATYATTAETWVEIRLYGPGTVQTGGGVIYLTENTNEYPETKVTVPCYLITGLSNTKFIPVSVKIAGATDQTKIRLICSYKSLGPTEAYSFFVAYMGVYYY